MPKLFPLTSPLLQKTIFIVLVLLILFSPFFSSPLALLAGLVVGLLIGNPYTKYSGKASKHVLQGAVVGLGFGINLYQVAETGLSGIIYTFASLAATMGIGLLLGRFFKTPSKLTHLVSSGTAICGGSAIAAVAPAIKAEGRDISVALGIVFILNALALFIFPWVGNLLHLSQEQFGIWAAIAIHDTSSVVGAAARYGDEALQIATTLKLTRALWIVPLALISGLLYKDGKAKVSIPLFIVLFVAASVLNTFLPALATITPAILWLAKKGLLLSLFLIGANISLSSLKSISAKPFWQGLILWIIVASTSLAIIYFSS
ncbi:YeiH family protein [Pontibacter ruber]|uniref:YeiH family protein n=1 Tax=Pontibacter ruber TaxID=1343895 RepID=A0ABW5CZ44_9BACT|nr:putative sulfate exporter family transporter [Pontibacter ruber]